MILFGLKNCDGREVAECIARMLLIDISEVHYLASEDKWQIGNANNVWMRVLLGKDDCRFRITFRDQSKKHREYETAFATMIRWRLRGEDIEIG